MPPSSSETSTTPPTIDRDSPTAEWGENAIANNPASTLCSTRNLWPPETMMPPTVIESFIQYSAEALPDIKTQLHPVAGGSWEVLLLKDDDLVLALSPEETKHLVDLLRCALTSQTLRGR